MSSGKQELCTEIQLHVEQFSIMGMFYKTAHYKQRYAVLERTYLHFKKGAGVSPCARMRVYVCVCVCMCVYVCACTHACVCVCMRVHAWGEFEFNFTEGWWFGRTPSRTPSPTECS